mmetsp:Transcript_82336/g.143670  ORF Transcript_82336/g.143670 Transcript_82336/m.143670 type:complete len:181 (+) Transcript_82336:71-613(+)
MSESIDQCWIGNLPEDFTQEQLKTTFSNYAEISWLKVLPSIPGLAGHTSSALIQFMSVTDAQWAVQNLNGNIPQGLTEPVVVKFAYERAKLSKGGGKGGKEKGKSDWTGGKDCGGKSGWTAVKEGGDYRWWTAGTDSDNSYSKASSKGANSKAQAPVPYSDGKGGKAASKLGEEFVLGPI